MGLILVNVRS